MGWTTAIWRLLALAQQLLTMFREYAIRRSEQAQVELETRKQIDEKKQVAADADRRADERSDADIDEDDGFRRD